MPTLKSSFSVSNARVRHDYWKSNPALAPKGKAFTDLEASTYDKASRRIVRLVAHPLLSS